MKSFTKKDIKAETITDWNHFNCKFLPGDYVMVSKTISKSGHWESKRLQSFAAHVGRVFAASSPDGKRMRGTYEGRQWTKYYVEFDNGEVGGFDSLNLTKDFEPYITPEERLARGTN